MADFNNCPLADIPRDVMREKILNVLKIYDYDISSKRKENGQYSNAFWRIKTYVDKHFTPDPPIEGGDVLDWAIGHLNWEQ